MKRIVVALALVGVLAAAATVVIHQREQKATATRLATSSRLDGQIQGSLQAHYATRILRVQISNKREVEAACHERLTATPGFWNLPVRPYEKAFLRSCVAAATKDSLTRRLSADQ